MTDWQSVQRTTCLLPIACWDKLQNPITINSRSSLENGWLDLREGGREGERNIQPCFHHAIDLSQTHTPCYQSCKNIINYSVNAAIHPELRPEQHSEYVKVCVCVCVRVYVCVYVCVCVNQACLSPVYWSHWGWSLLLGYCGVDCWGGVCVCVYSVSVCVFVCMCSCVCIHVCFPFACQ